jgi:hypothetical protein
MIRSPVLVYEPSNLRMFRSVSDAERYLEPADVRAGGFEAYDSEGRLLHLRISTMTRRILGVFRVSLEHVRVEAAEEDPHHAERLREVLIEYLEDVEAVEAGRVRDITLDELLGMARPLALTK